MRVILVVPTSRRVAPLTPMISGMRKLPPISISCPRETTTSFPAAKARRTITVAAAQLLTAVADSATLLFGKDGNCFAWSYLFADSLRAAGVKQTLMQRAVFRSLTSVGVAPNDQREKLLVKNWSFDPNVPGSGNATYPFQNMSKYPDRPGLYVETNAAKR